MPKPTKGPRLGGSPTHQRFILANLASQLFEHGRITTTEVRARRVQPLAEKLISKAKRGDLHSRRTVMKTITDTTIVHVLFTKIAPMMEKREGGYTRITKVGNRKGDNAPMAIIELVTEEVSPKPKRKKAEPVEKPAKADEVEIVDEVEADEAEDAEDDDSIDEESAEDAEETPAEDAEDN